MSKADCGFLGSPEPNYDSSIRPQRLKGQFQIFVLLQTSKVIKKILVLPRLAFGMLWGRGAVRLVDRRALWGRGR